MSNFFAKWWHQWKVLFSDKAYSLSFLAAALLLGAAYFVNFKVNAFNDSRFYASVGDLILDFLPVIDLGFIFSWGMYALIAVIVIYPLFFRPEIAPYTIKMFALLMFLRLGFILMTNIGPPAESFYLNAPMLGDDVIVDFLFRNDLFFSGHTAYPFLAALIYRDNRFLFWFFIFGTLIEAVTVLFMHLHYSIDVFAAFFIVYGTYKFGDWLFERMNLRFSTRLELYGWDVINKIKIWK